MNSRKTLLKGSIILLITFGLFNFMGYIFHFAMIRSLSVSDYGILATLFSIIYILALFSESIQTVIAKYSSSAKSNSLLKSLFKRTFKKALKLSFILFIIYLVISIPLSSLLKIDYSLLALNGLIIFTIFFMPISRGIMQGRKMFMSLGLNMIAESTSKLIFPIIFVFIGWKVYGAIAGVVLATFISFASSFFMLKDIFKAKEGNANTSGIYNYTTPVFVIIFTILIFFSLDIIIAKIVFSPENAGYYAIASILAKTIFFGTQPISKAMFPLTAENKSSGKNKHKIFLNALGIIFILIISSLLVFYFFPDILIKISSGKIIPESSSILLYLGIAMSLISLTNLNLLYKISLGSMKGYFYLPFFIVIEAIIMYVFSANLVEFSLAYITASAIFLWGSSVLIRP